jgi:DNA-binding MarR family transcriptional regulator
MKRKPYQLGGSGSLIVLIKTVQQALRTELDEALHDLGLTLPQLAVLASLTRVPGASNAELAREAFVSPQSMGELLATLKRRRWIERQPDPDNARVLQTTLTAAGLRALSRGGEAAARVEKRLVSALSEPEQRKLRSLLEHCIVALTAPTQAR